MLNGQNDQKAENENKIVAPLPGQVSNNLKQVGPKITTNSKTPGHPQLNV